ncbi:MAG: flagellar biosynthesis protein FlhA [Pseudomonadota bacterium]
MSEAIAEPRTTSKSGLKDIGFAMGIVMILTILFIPLPPVLVDFGLAISIALSVLILMVALWINKPLEFSSFPTILLIATMLRLSMNVATTRLILANGAEGPDAAGHVIGGFANFLMGDDFVIGVIVFIILLTVNFLVITKGATRIAEVGARFTLDAVPGKQMAIDADLSAGLISEQQAQERRRVLEEESAFFGSMDGASKFVRGDAIAGLIITAVNIFGGIIIGVARQGLSLNEAADAFIRLSVGDGLVSQIPALIISLAAGLLVSKGGERVPTEQVVSQQLGRYPRALIMVAGLMLLFAVAPGLPVLPFALLGIVLVLAARAIPRQRAEEAKVEQAKVAEKEKAEESARSAKESFRAPEIEVKLGRQLSSAMLPQHEALSHRMTRIRRRFAKQYGFVIPEIKLTDDLELATKSYEISIHGTIAATSELQPGSVLVVVGDGPNPSISGDEVREPAFGARALWLPEVFSEDLRQEKFTPIDPASVLLTHLAEVVRGNLSRLLSYKDVRQLLSDLDPEYQRLLEEISPAHISYSGLQAILKSLLAERVSIINLHLILEAIAEIAPHVRRTEQIVEHVRIRLAQQICGDLAAKGVLSVLRLGNRWDLAFHESLRRDASGDISEFDIDPRLLEEFSKDATASIQSHLDSGEQPALVVEPDARPYVRMVIERLFSGLPVLSHVEIARGVEIRSLGTIS